MAADPGEPVTAEEMRGFRLSEQVVLLTYRVNRPDRASLRSSIWTVLDGYWTLVFHQGTPLPL